MTKLINFFISIVVFISSVFGIDLGCGMKPKDNKPVDLSNYELVWYDEFEGNELNRDKWNDNQNVATLHWGPVRKGGFQHRDVISVSDGNLRIRPKYLTAQEAAAYGNGFREGWYAGFITTYDSNPLNTSEPDTFLYGYFETRCILPAGQGLWSAFWMMNEGVYKEDGNGRDGTEIDIFEGFGYKDGDKMTADLVSVNLHWDGYNEAHEHYNVGEFYAVDPYNSYNTYGVMWTPQEYIFYINGKECARTNKGGVSQNPECLLLSVEIAGENGIPSLDHGDITKNGDNVEFTVDYVRVYQAKK